jgi:hypothetical protein
VRYIKCKVSNTCLQTMNHESRHLVLTLIFLQHEAKGETLRDWE